MELQIILDSSELDPPKVGVEQETQQLQIQFGDDASESGGPASSAAAPATSKPKKLHLPFLEEIRNRGKCKPQLGGEQSLEIRADSVVK